MMGMATTTTGQVTAVMIRIVARTSIAATNAKARE